MLLYPPIDKLTEKFDNPYKLAVVVGKRARYLNKTNEFTTDEEERNEIKPVTQAVIEVFEDKITGE